MSEKLRKTGIHIIGDVPWGTHFCQLYKTKKDLLDILVPYFSAGLKNNEYCMWATSEPLNEAEIQKAMKKALPGFDRYLKKGQIEIIPHTQWYLKGGRFNSQRVLNGWVDKLNQALAGGYEGLRLTGNTFWLEKKDWRKFTDYEEEVNSIIGEYKMIAICTYSIDKCGANEVIDVVRNHQFALIKREKSWELIESSERKEMEEALRRSRDELEIRVKERTSELKKANEELRAGITERQLADAKVREQADLLELTHDAIIVRDMNDRIVFWNRGAEETYGWTREEAMGNVSHVFLQTQSPKPLAEITNDLLETGRWQGELVDSNRDGSRIAVETRQVLTRDKGGKPLGTLEIDRDITKRKRAQEALRTASLYTRSLIEASLDPLVTISADGKVMDVNKATEQATGVPREQLIKSDFSDYFTEPDKARKGYLQVFSRGSVKDYPLAIRHTSGQIVEVLYNATV